MSELKTEPFVWQLRVYYADTGAGINQGGDNKNAE
jgi:hypothetical protein